MLTIALTTHSDTLATEHSGTITGSVTWYAVDNPHIVIDFISIPVGSSLTIQDGADIQLHPYMVITVDGGSLVAEGTEEAGVTFGRSGAAAWNGLWVQNGGHLELRHCTITGGGTAVYARTSDCVVSLASCIISSNGTGYYGKGVAPVLLDGETVIENNFGGMYLSGVPGLAFASTVTLRDNTSYGIHIDACSGVALDNLVMTGHVGDYGALQMTRTSDFVLGAGNVIGSPGQENSWAVTIDVGSGPGVGCVIPSSGNIHEGIQVCGGTSTTAATWRPVGLLPYVVTDYCTVGLGGSLTVEDGVVVKLDPHMVITIAGGSLVAEGTEEAGVTFGRSGAAAWNGLWVQDGGNMELSHCTITGGGAVVYIRNTPGTVSLNSCTISGSSIGLYMSGGVAQLTDVAINGNGTGVGAYAGLVSVLHCVISANINYGVYMTNGGVNYGSSLAEWNCIYNNGAGEPGRDLRNGSNDIVAEYIYWGSISNVHNVVWDKSDDSELGRVDYSPWLNAEYTLTGMENGLDCCSAPPVFRLRQNVPNPFNPATTIRFDLPVGGRVRLEVYDVAGRLVRTLLDSDLPAGSNQAVWDGTDSAGRGMPSGSYFARLSASGKVETVRMGLVR